MIVALQNAYKRIYETLNRITPASWILDRVASLIVAKPEELKQSPDFWYDIEERGLPNTKDYLLPPVQMDQVGSDHFRRHLRRDLALHTMLVFMVLCTAIFIAGKLAIWMVKPDLEQGPGVPVASSSTTAPPAQPQASKKRAVPLSGKDWEISPNGCKQLQADLENQVVFLTTPSIYDASEACRAQGLL